MSNNPFLETRFPVGVAMGSQWADAFSVEITTTAGMAEHRRLVQPYPARQFSVAYTAEIADYWTNLLALYQRAYGMYAGFRVKCIDDYTTNGRVDAPTAFDQILTLISAGVYQLLKQYGLGGSPISLGYPVRTIYKPVAGTTLVAIGTTSIRSADWSVDTTTGQVTFAADQTKSITGISKASSAVITVGASHGFVTGQSVQISGCSGMTQINSQRALITGTGATTITVAIDSTAYGTWTSGGAVHTRPQSGEIVYGGCEFDIPCRFNSMVPVGMIGGLARETGQIDIVELISP